MALEQDLFSFSYGALVEIELLAKEPDGEVVQTPGSQVVSMVISETRGGAAVLTFNSSPQVTLQDTNAGEFLIQLNESDYSALTEGQRYYYEIWSQLSTNPPLLQARGQITLKVATGV